MKRTSFGEALGTGSCGEFLMGKGGSSARTPDVGGGGRRTSKESLVAAEVTSAAVRSL
jgi:hypothetical protein